MEQKIISQTNERFIYFIRETNLDFYLIIPNCKQVSIVLGLFPNVTEDVVKTLPKETDKAIVVPVINAQILTQANQLEPTSFKYLDGVLSYLINAAYKILTFNHIEVNSKIYLNNHSSYQAFNQKYIERYQNRVELYNLIQKPIPKPTMPINIHEPQPEVTLNSIVNNQNTTLEEKVEPILYDEPVTPNANLKEAHEPGFVSYVLLGVLVAVISLVFLYLIL